MTDKKEILLRIEDLTVHYGAAQALFGIDLANALIAASAALHQAQLVTLNARHFPMLEVEVPYSKTA